MRKRVSESVCEREREKVSDSESERVKVREQEKENERGRKIQRYEGHLTQIKCQQISPPNG